MYINNKTLSTTGGKRRVNSSRKSLVYLTLSKALVASSIVQNTAIALLLNRSRPAGRVLSLRDVQRELRAPAGSRGCDDVSTVRAHEIRPVYERGPRQCRLFGRSTAAARSQVLRTSDMSRDRSGRSSAQRAPVSERTDALLGGQLHLSSR